MILYIVRHGIAIDRGEQGVKTDEARFLSAKGRKRTDGVAAALAGLDCHPDVIWTSPLVRAHQSADILAKYLQPMNGVQTAHVLSAETNVTKILEWIRSLRVATAMIVGHNPDLECLASMLIFGQAQERIILKKAGVCRISFSRKPVKGAGRLEWLLQPKHLLAMA